MIVSISSDAEADIAEGVEQVGESVVNCYHEFASSPVVHRRTFSGQGGSIS